MQRKTYAQTVNEARETLFKVARNPNPPNTLPAGRRSMFDALIKAREDINSKARKDQAANPAPPSSESDPGVVRSSFTPVAEPSQGEPSATPTAGPGPMSSTTNPTGSYSADGAARPSVASSACCSIRETAAPTSDPCPPIHVTWISSIDRLTRISSACLS